MSNPWLYYFTTVGHLYNWQSVRIQILLQEHLDRKVHFVFSPYYRFTRYSIVLSSCFIKNYSQKKYFTTSVIRHISQSTAGHRLLQFNATWFDFRLQASVITINMLHREIYGLDLMFLAIVIWIHFSIKPVSFNFQS